MAKFSVGDIVSRVVPPYLVDRRIVSIDDNLSPPQYYVERNNSLPFPCLESNLVLEKAANQLSQQEDITEPPKDIDDFLRRQLNNNLRGVFT